MAQRLHGEVRNPENDTMTVAYDPFSPAFQTNPYPTLDLLRREDPVHCYERLGLRFWLTTRYDDCVAVLRDPRCTAEKFPPEVLARVAQEPESPLAQLAAVVQGMMLVKDPPDHTRLRNLVNKAFTPRVVEGLRPRLERVVEEIIDGVRDTGRMDVIADLAAPFPLIAIAELLGIAAQDHEQLKRWSDDLATFIDGTIREAGLARAARASSEICEYLREVFAQRRREPRDDLVSRLLEAHDGADALSEQELFGTVILLLGAGHETTTNLIGNGTLALLRHPVELEKLRRHPELIRSAVEELLRYESPVQVTSRIPREPIEIRGRKIAAGQEINVSLAGANRDPAEFSEPDRLDLARDPRHLSFGFGAHFCLGAALARLEGQLALAALARLPGLALDATDDDIHWRPGIVLRGVHSLPVRFA